MRRISQIYDFNSTPVFLQDTSGNLQLHIWWKFRFYLDLKLSVSNDCFHTVTKNLLPKKSLQEWCSLSTLAKSWWIIGVTATAAFKSWPLCPCYSEKYLISKERYVCFWSRCTSVDLLVVNEYCAFSGDVWHCYFILW